MDKNAGFSWVLEVHGEQPVPARRLYLVPGEHEVGAVSSAEVHLPVPGVSRSHARLEVLSDGGVLISDLGSRNGTFLGDRKVSRVAVSAPCSVTFGGVITSLAPLRQELATIAVATAFEEHGGGRQEDPAGHDSTTRASTLEERLIGALSQALRSAGREQAASALVLQWYSLLDADGLEITSGDSAGSEAVVVASVGSCDGHPAVTVSGAGWVLRGWCETPLLTRLQPFFEVALAAIASGAAQPETAEVSGRSQVPVSALPPPGSLNEELLDTYRQCGRVARGDIPLLILGESGTGKEVLARWVHSRSRRTAGPFLAINCAALPRELLEAELFGIERGVATGVDERPGIIEQAHGGTVFLDELGDMALEIQARVLRALESTSVFRVGGRRTITTDVRFIAATNQPVQEQVQAGTLRRDLYHRLAASVATLPPLRRRPEDIPLLAAHFLVQQLQQLEASSPGITRGALAALVSAPWPGNVRELENEIRRAVLLLEPGEPLDLVHLSERFRGEEHSQTGLPLTLEETVRRSEFQAIRLAQAAAGDDPAGIIELLGISRATYYRKLRELGLG